MLPTRYRSVGSYPSKGGGLAQSTQGRFLFRRHPKKKRTGAGNRPVFSFETRSINRRRILLLTICGLATSSESETDEADRH
jgi:hypothetical protein